MPAEIEVSPQSRVQILNAPAARPGNCILCGSADSETRQFIDFGMVLDWYGAVYFCTVCFAEVARILGWITPDEDMSLAQLHAEAELTIGKLRFAMSEQAGMIRAMVANCDCNFLGLGDAEPDSIDSSIDDSPAEADSDPDESGSIKGFGSVHVTRNSEPE